jgi:hypothetical protein
VNFIRAPAHDIFIKKITCKFWRFIIVFQMFM